MAEVLGWDPPLTHRQAKVLAAWDEMEINHPNRSDFYAMQTACEVRRVLSSKPAEIKMEHFRLEFVKPEPEVMVDEYAGLTEEEKLAKVAGRSQSIWFGLTGFRSGKRGDQPLKTGPGPEGKPGIGGSDLEVKVAAAARSTKGKREEPRPKGSNPPKPGARPIRSLEPGMKPVEKLPSPQQSEKPLQSPSSADREGGQQ